jgi:hypothetical protein
MKAKCGVKHEPPHEQYGTNEKMYTGNRAYGHDSSPQQYFAWYSKEINH